MSPRKPSQFKEIREEKRSLIMDTALEHFAKEGFHSTTINHIAKHAGISKGLMYNYFSSKDELLAEIIDRSVSEMYLYFDADRDGFLSDEEFELFIRKIFKLLKENRSFWRLFFQLMIQKDVMDNYLKRYKVRPEKSKQQTSANITPAFISDVNKIFTDYFLRRRTNRPKDYDPIVDMNLCISTLKGFAMSTVFSDEMEDNLYEKTINRIIEIYK